eukprot:EG_transcript_10929
MPYHKDCLARQQGDFCAACYTPITGKLMEAVGKKWHPECFVCAVCRQPLGVHFISRNGAHLHPYCAAPPKPKPAPQSAGWHQGWEGNQGYQGGWHPSQQASGTQQTWQQHQQQQYPPQPQYGSRGPAPRGPPPGQWQQSPAAQPPSAAGAPRGPPPPRGAAPKGGWTTTTSGPAQVTTWSSGPIVTTEVFKSSSTSEGAMPGPSRGPAPPRPGAPPGATARGPPPQGGWSQSWTSAPVVTEVVKTYSSTNGSTSNSGTTGGPVPTQHTQTRSVVTQGGPPGRH